MESTLALLPWWWSLLFLWADLTESVTITSTEQTMVTKAQGEKVTLLCTFTLGAADTGALDIEWVVLQPEEEQPVIMFIDRVYDEYQMSGRVQFVNPNPASGDASIDILNLKPADTGVYQCKVKKLPGVQTHRVQLTVLEKPLKTRCFVEGSQEIGTDVTLKCKSQEGTPVINYYWKKVDSIEELPLGATQSCCLNVGNSICEVSVGGQPLFNTSYLIWSQNSISGDLLVKNTSHIHSGTYKCVASNRVGTDECSVVLNITPPINRAGTIAGAVVGTLLGMLLLTFIVFFCCKKQRDKKYEKEVHHDIREDVPPPKSRASTARSYIGSNRSSLGSMSPSNMDGYAKTQYNKVPSEDFERTSSQNPNFPPPKVAAPNLSRMGAIPVMIPAQSKDGSIV